MQSEDEQRKRLDDEKEIDKREVVQFDIRDHRVVIHVVSGGMEDVSDRRNLLVNYSVKISKCLELWVRIFKITFL